MKKKVLAVAVLMFSSGVLASFKIAAIPDTQRMTQYYPERFRNEMRWIRDHVDSENIAFLTHLGDVVDDDENVQWAAANDAMNYIDEAGIAYSICLGNHDYDTKGPGYAPPRDVGTTKFTNYFGSVRFSGEPWYVGTGPHGLCSAQVFSAGGRDWLHLNVEYMADDEELLWAQRMLDAHPTLPAILSTHAFLKPDGTLGGSDSQKGLVSNGGAAQWSKFVSHNDQIFLVLNGHYFIKDTSDGVAHLTLVNDYGHDVFFQCIDYQYEDDNDHFRILEFDLANNVIHARSYSPYNDSYLTDPENQFDLSIDFDSRFDFSPREDVVTIQAANITVVENNTDNNSTSVTVSIPNGQSTSAFSVVEPGSTNYAEHSNGDYFVKIGSRSEDDLLNGILIACVAQNGRVNLDGNLHYHLAQATTDSHGDYYIATADVVGGSEKDVNVNAAYFPFTGKWASGRLLSISNGSPTWAFVGSEDIHLGENLTQLPQGTISDTNLLARPGGLWSETDGDRGVWNLEIPGEDSMQDGVLLVCGGRNENNFAMASPWPDGSGWQMAEKGSGGGGTTTECDPLNFAYVPYSTANIVAGRADGDGQVLSGTGGFSITRLEKGRTRLDIDGHSPADGTLIVSSELDGYSVDDFTTCEPEGDHWVVENRDLPGAGLAGSSSAQFSFLFVPFAAPPARPGPGSGSDYYSVEWAGGDGLWLESNNWVNADYADFRGVPGWVVGNPLNTAGRTNRDWSASHAFINGGIARITPDSVPDGRVGALDVGSATSATLEISADLVVKGETTLGAGSLAGSTATINQTAGNVVLGTAPALGFRTYFGRGAGESVYNLSGGTLSTFADYDHFGRSGTGTFAFNQTGGTYRKVGGRELKVAVDSGVSASVNVADGLFECGADWLWVGVRGHGEFNQTGGDVRIKRLSMAHDAGATGTYRISGGSLVVTNAISGSQADSKAARFVVSGSGASRIETMRFYGWDDVLRVELDGGGSTLIRVSSDAGGTYDSAYADLRKCRLEVDSLPGFDAPDGSVFDVLWSEGDLIVGDDDPAHDMLFTNQADSVRFDWRVVRKDGGKMLQLVAGEGPVYDGVYALGLRKDFPITDAAQTQINVSGGIAFDPSSQSGGAFARLYLVNRTDVVGKRGLYAIDLANESYSGLLAMDGASPELKYPADVAVDASGTAYVTYNYAPAVWKIEDPLSTATSTRMLANYGADGGDDDPECLALVPNGFDGGFAAGADLVLFDSGIDANENEGIGIVDAASTAASPAYSNLWNDAGGGSDDALRGDASEFDGHLYFVRTTLESADLDGKPRAYVSRIDSAGTLERVFLDIDPAAISTLDDAMAINPVDGSLWLNVQDVHGSDPERRNIYRVDLAHAAPLGGGDYLAEVGLAIWNTGHNLGKNGMAISPDGRQLATACPDGQDRVVVYDIVSQTPFTDWAEEYGLRGADALSTNDYDGDGLGNLYEYGLGGDPTNPSSQGILPTFGTDGGGTNGFRYVYPRRSDPASGIAYHLELTTNLVSGVWTNAGYETVGAGPIDSEFDAVTNRIPAAAEDEQYIRLIIEETFWFEQ